MMYEVNKYSLAIQERPDIQPHSKHFVMVKKRKRGKDTSYAYYAETIEEAQAKLAELKADKIRDLERAIEYHETQALYNRGRLAAILGHHLPDAGKLIEKK